MLVFPDLAVPKEGTKGLNLYWDILTKVELSDTIIRAQRDLNPRPTTPQAAILSKLNYGSKLF